MACEARIVRVLRTLEYPETASLSPQTLMQNREELARVVSWVEDRKVRGCAIDDRAPLRVAGPGWEEAFFSYLSKIECPYKFADATGRGDRGDELLRGLSWLVSKALACEFEDRGKEYNDSAREVLSGTTGTRAGSLPGEASAQASTGNGNGTHAMEVDTGGDGGQWSPAFLSALETACRALGVQAELCSPSPVPPAPPSTNAANASVGAAEVVKARVADAMEALLLAVQGRGSGEGSVPDGDIDEGVTAMCSADGARHGDLAAFASGVCTGDASVDRVATVLRMLFLLDLRALQDEVNVLLAMAQNIKAS